MTNRMKGVGGLPPVSRAILAALLAFVVFSQALAAEDDLGLCRSFYTLDSPIDVGTCTQEFVDCYDQGFEDNYLCEGCSLVSSQGTTEVTDGSLDSDCACTCCFYQYVFNYCYRNYCDDTDENTRARSYMSNVCSTAPVRTSIKPYIDSDEDLAADHVLLFVSNDNSVYRTLEDDEKSSLFEYISESLNMGELRSRFPSIEKRSLDDDETDETLESDEEDDQDHDENDEEVEDDDSNEVDELDDLVYHDDEEYPQIDYSDVGSHKDTKLEGSTELTNVEHPVVESNHTFLPRDSNPSRDRSEETLDPDDFPDVKDPQDIEGIEPIEPSRLAALESAKSNRKPLESAKSNSRLLESTKSNRKPLARRDISIERLEQVFQGGPAKAFGDIRDFSLGQLQDVFDAVGDENVFLTGLKMYLDSESYQVLYTAYEHSYDQTQISKDEWETLLEETRLDCQDEYSSVLYNSVFSSDTGTPDPSAMGMLGCALGYYAKVARVLGGLFIKGRSSCKSRCNFGTQLIQCLDTYKGASDFLDGVTDWEIVKNLVDAVCVHADDNEVDSTAAASEEMILGYEEKVADDISYYHHLEPVAAPMSFKEELAEIEAEYLWKTTSSEELDPLAVSAAVVLDKCEMEQGDLNDYLQFSLDSCDIRDLYYCKNHYKHTKCLPDLTNTTNPCNNACCLEIKMADCAKTHCASKKAVNEFRVIANVVCSKYADAAYMNGELPFPEAGTTVSTSTSGATSTMDCGDETTSTATKTKSTLRPSKTLDYDDDDEDQSFDKRYFDEYVGDSIIAQFGGNNDDDVKARVGESVCKLDEFSPGYDTSTCDKREIKDCIKEGIQYIKDDPEHFCPYCVNNNAYDECRCACCFGKYFSKVCYDPNCKDLSEKLRYKRYVKDVCKTKPITKFLFARDTSDSQLGFVEDKPRFKTQRAGKKFPQVTTDDDIDIFAGFEDIQPEVDTGSLHLPTNPSSDLLDTMRKSSLRRPAKGTRFQKRQRAERPVKSLKGTPASEEVDALTNLVEKAHQKLGTSPSKFAKGALFRGSKPKKGRFSIQDRKKNPTGERKSAESSQVYNGVTRRKKHRRVVGKSGKVKKAGRRTSLSGEKFGRGGKKKQKIRVLNSNTDPKFQTTRRRVPIAKRGFYPSQYVPDASLHESVIPSGQKNALVKRKEEQSVLYIKGPEIQENPIVLMNILQSISESHDMTGSPAKAVDGPHEVGPAWYKTVTKTLTKSATGDVPSAVTSTSTTTMTVSLGPSTSESVPVPTSSAAPSNEQSSYAPSTTTVHLTATVTSPLTITDTSTFLSTQSVTATTICEVSTNTLTSIQTRYRKSTATKIEYQSVSTLTTTEWSDITTETSYKKTVFKYKDTYYETETIPTTVVMTSTEEKIVPNITVTEFEESDHTVNITLTLLDTTTETDYETAYREVSVSTLTTYSSTLTTSVYKYTKTKFKKTGEVTTTTTTTETDDVILTRWYPEMTITEYDQTLTKVKYKWYPITYTEYDTEWDTSTTTTVTTSLSTITVNSAARPVPSGIPNLASVLSSLLGRRDYNEQEAYELSKREWEEYEELGYNPNVEYVIIEEIVEVIYPGDDGIDTQSVSQILDLHDEDEDGDDSPLLNDNSGNTFNTSASKTMNETKEMGYSRHSKDSRYRNKSHVEDTDQEDEESGTNRMFLDNNIVYASSLLLLLAGATFILAPDGDDDERLAQGVQEHDAGVLLDNNEPMTGVEVEVVDN